MEMESDWRFSHIGMVVRDLEKTVATLRSLGVFTIPAGEPLVLEGKNPDGAKPAGTILRFDVICGDLSIELLQPVSGDNIQQRWLDAHGEGVSHVCFDVPDIGRARAAMAAKGVPVACHIREATSYYDTTKDTGLQIELCQVTGDP
jgi:4-hydroxyphenylpyruvate dioxygenase-like putative hemolysin